MYFILRDEGEGNPKTLCLVEAETSEKAKEMVGVPKDSVNWTAVLDSLVDGLSGVKEGYIARSL